MVNNATLEAISSKMVSYGFGFAKGLIIGMSM